MSNYGLYLSEVRADYARAQKVYERALKVDPAHANTCYNYAVMLDAGLKDVPRAVDMYERAIASKPSHAFALYNLAVLNEEKLKDLGRAGDLYRAAVHAGPTDVLAVSDLGRFLAQRGLADGDAAKTAEGEALLKKALGMDARCATAHAALGELRLMGGDAQAARAHHQKALAADPNGSAVRRLTELVARAKQAGK